MSPDVKQGIPVLGMLLLLLFMPPGCKTDFVPVRLGFTRVL